MILKRKERDMTEWFLNNYMNILLILMLAAVVALAVRSLIRNKKAGSCACGGSCGACPGCGACAACRRAEEEAKCGKKA